MLCAFGRQQSASLGAGHLDFVVGMCLSVMCHDSGMEVRGQLSVSCPRVGSQACRKCCALPAAGPLLSGDSLIVELIEWARMARLPAWDEKPAAQQPAVLCGPGLAFSRWRGPALPTELFGSHVFPSALTVEFVLPFPRF